MTAHLAEMDDTSTDVTAVAELLADCVTVQSDATSVAESWKVRQNSKANHISNAWNVG